MIRQAGGLPPGAVDSVKVLALGCFVRDPKFQLTSTSIRRRVLRAEPAPLWQGAFGRNLPEQEWTGQGLNLYVRHMTIAKFSKGKNGGQGFSRGR